MPRIVVNDYCFNHFSPAAGVSEFLSATDTNPADALVALVQSVWKSEYDAKTQDFLIRVGTDDWAQFGSIVCGQVELTTATTLATTFATRPRALPGELPFLNTKAVDGKKTPAACADLVIYPNCMLTDNERHTVSNGLKVPVSADFHIVTILAHDRKDVQAVTTPLTAARNYANLIGMMPEGIGGNGKERESSPETFLFSLLYWRNKVMCAPAKAALCEPPVDNILFITESTAGVCEVDETVQVKAVFAPAVEGSKLPFLQFQATNRDDLNCVMGWEERPPTPAELALAHASYIGLPEGNGVKPYLPTAKEYARSIWFYARHALLPSFDRRCVLPGLLH